MGWINWFAAELAISSGCGFIERSSSRWRSRVKAARCRNRFLLFRKSRPFASFGRLSLSQGVFCANRFSLAGAVRVRAASWSLIYLLSNALRDPVNFRDLNWFCWINQLKFKFTQANKELNLLFWYIDDRRKIIKGLWIKLCHPEWHFSMDVPLK